MCRTFGADLGIPTTLIDFGPLQLMVFLILPQAGRPRVDAEYEATLRPQDFTV